MRMKNDNSDPNSNSPFNKALKYLSYRPRSTKEIVDYLSKKNFSEEDIKETLEKLNEYKFLDDAEFSRIFARSRQNKGKSKRIISIELRQKGISKQTAEKTLEESQDDLRTARKYIEKKIGQFNKLPKDEKKKKIINRLRLRGYNWDVISKILEETKNL